MRACAVAVVGVWAHCGAVDKGELKICCAAIFMVGNLASVDLQISEHCGFRAWKSFAVISYIMIGRIIICMIALKI